MMAMEEENVEMTSKITNEYYDDYQDDYCKYDEDYQEDEYYEYWKNTGS